MSPQRLRRCLWCCRRLPLRGFPPIPDKKRSKSRYCSGCWEYPVPDELQVLHLRYVVEVLSRRWSQPSLFLGLVERVMVRELADSCADLRRLEQRLSSAGGAQ